MQSADLPENDAIDPIPGHTPRLKLPREWPTWGLAAAIYGGWIALTLAWRHLPWFAVLPASAWLCAWQMSLQHEVLHGHPTRSRRVNDALGFPPLNLWLPYALYRASHLRHHREAWLTDPLEDPESTYIHPARWARLGWAGRALVCCCNTLLGRMAVGPARAMGRLYRAQALRIAGGETALLRIWAAHALGVAAVLAWVVGVCGIPPAAYVALFVYPGLSLALVRSLAEHRAAPPGSGRTAVVEHAGLLGLLYLHNNLHAVHHARPAVPWYRLPALWRARRAAFLAAKEGPVYRGYGDVARRFLVTPHHPGPHPATP
jgi:fatty acid desaturase